MMQSNVLGLTWIFFYLSGSAISNLYSIHPFDKKRKKIKSIQQMQCTDAPLELDYRVNTKSFYSINCRHKR
jgi:hypothetical protein